MVCNICKQRGHVQRECTMQIVRFSPVVASLSYHTWLTRSTLVPSVFDMRRCRRAHDAKLPCGSRLFRLRRTRTSVESEHASPQSRPQSVRTLTRWHHFTVQECPAPRSQQRHRGGGPMCDRCGSDVHPANVCPSRSAAPRSLRTLKPISLASIAELSDVVAYLPVSDPASPRRNPDGTTAAQGARWLRRRRARGRSGHRVGRWRWRLGRMVLQLLGRGTLGRRLSMPLHLRPCLVLFANFYNLTLRLDPPRTARSRGRRDPTCRTSRPSRPTTPTIRPFSLASRRATIRRQHHHPSVGRKTPAGLATSATVEWLRRCGTSSCPLRSPTLANGARSVSANVPANTRASAGTTTAGSTRPGEEETAAETVTSLQRARTARETETVTAEGTSGMSATAEAGPAARLGPDGTERRGPRTRRRSTPSSREAQAPTSSESTAR